MNIEKLRTSLRLKPLQLGLFCCSHSVQITEAIAGSGYEFLIIDTEHCPNDLINLHHQLLALENSDTSAVIRTSGIDPVQIKRLLDLGVQGLMIPNVETLDQAQAVVACCHYAPHGRRGIAGSVRGSNYGRVKLMPDHYPKPVLMLQAESRVALENISAISALDGVDAIFFGPNDLAADMGHLGQPNHPAVVEAIKQGIQSVLATGKQAGILANEANCAQYIQAGASILALGSEMGLLVASADSLRERVANRFATTAT